MFLDNKIILDSNFYSYTEPMFKTITHHWGAGVIFFLIYKFWGYFKGLHVFYMLLSVLPLVFIYLKSFGEKTKGWFWILPLALPLYLSRLEVRPEAFSYLFFTDYFLLLIFFQEFKDKRRYIWCLPFFTIIWANIHIFFIFGNYLIGVYFLYNYFLIKDKEYGLTLLKVFILSMLATCITPFGVEGAIYPFLILKEYGYMIAENQSVWFMHKRVNRFNYIAFELLAVVSLIFGFLFLKIKGLKDKLTPEIIILLTFQILSWSMVRNFPLFAICGLITLPKLISHFNINKFINGALIIVSISILYKFINLDFLKPKIGLYPGILKADQFVKTLNLKGPIFNNYDIGGYLIFNGHKVFVDNRPEAYSVDFFKKIYVPMQEDESKWNEYSTKFDFNLIYFYRLDNTPWAQSFLIRRSKDPNWIPVFVDAFNIIFIKNHLRNQDIIKRYALPRSMFGIK